MSTPRESTGAPLRTSDLFTPVALGALHLSNRLVMAPMTRMRADAQGVPDDLVVQYYRQRASIGMIVSEGIFPAQVAKGYSGQPGLVTPAQCAGWRRVTDAVHERGGLIVAQLMHSGRVSHLDINGTDRVVGPSAIALRGKAHTPHGKQDYAVPHALTAQGLAETTSEFVTAAENAMRAGFDGVELHGANGYLLHQFLSRHSNARADEYGGSPENRARYVVEVTMAVAGAIGPDRVGLRISPEHGLLDVVEDDPVDAARTYEALLSALAGRGLAYLSLLHRELRGDLACRVRDAFGGPLVCNSGFDAVTRLEDAVALVEDSHADAVAIGRLALANPDIAERWATGAPENDFDASTFYTAGARGLTDYPTHTET